VITSLLPPEVQSDEIFARTLPDFDVVAGEEHAVAGVVDARRREFAAVRALARASLSRLGRPPGPILPGAGGAPQWPEAIVGSMTHCTGYAAAAVACATAVCAVGIDAEPDAALPSGVLDLVATFDERSRLPQRGDPHWDRLLFSAKESVYKAWFPLTQTWLDHEDVEIVWSQTGSTFRAVGARRLLPTHAALLSRLEGRWGCAGGILVTTVSAPPDD
jgi:4'-phosphopantetheinyl transferase EntD